MIANHAKLDKERKKSMTPEVEQKYDYNLEFFNILISGFNDSKENLYNIKSADELFFEIRKRIFKCQTSSPVIVLASIERSLNIYQNDMKVNKRKMVNTIKKSSSCPQFSKSYSCINAGCVHRCLYSSIQAHVTQVFKNMDFDFDNKLSYIEFRSGVINILYGEGKFKLEQKSLKSKTKMRQSIISSLNPSIRNDFLKCQVDISLFFECPIDESILFELFLRFDKNVDGVIDFGEILNI